MVELDYKISTVSTPLVWALGIPGNILSAIIWLRRRQNSSAIYLAALAINDLVILLITLSVRCIPYYPRNDLYQSFSIYVLQSAYKLEPLIILGFSVERLFAILRPLQVSFPYTSQLIIKVSCHIMSFISANSNISDETDRFIS